MHHIPLVDEPQADPATQRGRDPAVRQLQLLVVDLGLINANHSLKLRHGCFLGVVLLLREHALLPQLLITRQIQTSES